MSISKPIDKMSIEELLEEESDASYNIGQGMKFNEDTRRLENYMLKVSEEIEKCGRPRKTFRYENQDSDKKE